jgi:hypothetical protein
VDPYTCNAIMTFRRAKAQFTTAQAKPSSRILILDDGEITSAVKTRLL